MNALEFSKLSVEQKKKIFKSAAKGANKDQRAVVEMAKKMGK